MSKGKLMEFNSYRALKAILRALALMMGEVGASGGIRPMRDRPAFLFKRIPVVPSRQLTETGSSNSNDNNLSVRCLLCTRHRAHPSCGCPSQYSRHLYFHLT